MLTDNSASVHSHLGMLQSVVQRMAANSSQCKTWSITVVSAVLVVVANKRDPSLVWIAALPASLFLVLDAYYLSYEKAFRSSYNSFVAKIHTGALETADFYSIDPSGSMFGHTTDAYRSFSVWGFYGGLVLMILAVRYFVLGVGVTNG